MDNHETLETELMDGITGKPLPGKDPTPGAGEACGVKELKRCSRKSYWMGTIFFDCINYNYCDEFLNQCSPPLTN